MSEVIEFTDPGEHECEQASNSYLMSLVAVTAGMPLPIMNLLATVIFYLGSRRSTHFVRWHCTQALLSQLSFLLINSYGFWWTVSIIFSKSDITNEYIAYIIAVVLFNLVDMVATIYTAVQTRKGKHIRWFFYGTLSNVLCKK